MKTILYIGNKLFRHGFNQTTIETLGPLLEQEGFTLTYTSNKKNQYFRILDMLFSVVQNRRTDYVIIDTYSTSSFWYAWATSQLCRILKLKYIPFLHGGNLPHRLEKNDQLCKMIFNHSHTNVVPSLYLADEFNAKGYSNCTYIPNTIEINRYSFKERKSIRPNLLWVRSFAEIYNPIMAIQVFDAIKKKYPDAKLTMVGPDKDGSLLKTQKRARELGLEVHFSGKLSREAWTALSQEYDIFINTTHFDNMPISLVEAMSLGIAIVSTNVGGIPFLVEDNKEAVLVPDNAINDMVSGIIKLIENQIFYQELVTNARNKAEEFDWNVIKYKWFKIIK